MSLRGHLGRIERAYWSLPTLRVRWVAVAAAIALVFLIAADFAANVRTQEWPTAAFNSITTFMRGRPQELIDTNYYKAQAAAFLKQFYESPPEVTRYDIHIDPTELSRLESVVDDRRDQQPLWDNWKNWYSQGDRKTALAFLKDGEILHPIHVRIRGEGMNHFLGPLKSWRIARIPLPEAPPWPLPATVMNLSVPEFHLIEWLAFEIARRAGMATPFVEPVSLYVNGVFQGIRLAEDQTGPAYMRRGGLPIGFMIDLRNDRWEQPEQPPGSVMFDYDFGNVSMGRDFRALPLRIENEQIVDLLTFFILYRTIHIVDLRIYVDPLYKSVELIPWNLEQPRPATSRYYDNDPPLHENNFDLSARNFEELASVTYIFRDVIYPRVTPEMVYEVFSKIFALTREGQPLELEKLKSDYLTIEQRLNSELEAFPYWYNSRQENFNKRDFNFYRDARETSVILKEQLLFPALDRAFNDALQEAKRLELACAYSRNADDREKVLGRLRCRSAAAVGAVMTGLEFSGTDGAPLDLVWDTNRNGLVDGSDRLFQQGGGGNSRDGVYRFAGDGFHVLNDGRTLDPFQAHGRLNEYDFLLLGGEASGAPVSAHIRQPLTGEKAVIPITGAEPARYGARTPVQGLAQEGNRKRPALPAKANQHDLDGSLPPFIRKTGENAYAIGAGLHRVTSPVVLPEHASLRIEPGTSIALSPSAYLYVTGPLIAEGTAEAPIVFTNDGTSAPGGNVIVNYTRNGTTRLKHCVFERMGGAEINRVDYSGALTVLGADATIESCTFRDLSSGDAVSIKWGSADIDSVRFERLASDAIDFEFASGTVRASHFSDIGGDALDFDDSSALVEEASVDGARDKGLSVGGRSFVTIRSSEMRHAAVGVQVRDDSHVDVRGSVISGADVAIHLHRAHENKNSMTVSLENNRYEGNGVSILKDPGTPERGVRRAGQSF